MTRCICPCHTDPWPSEPDEGPAGACVKCGCYDPPRLYQVQAAVTVNHGTWYHTAILPTFYLDANVQGIVTREQASRIAREIVRDPEARITIMDPECNVETFGRLPYRTGGE